MHLLHLNTKTKTWEPECEMQWPSFERILERERALLSRFAHDPTAGRLRGEKEKGSTRVRLRVDSGIGSFFKLLEVGFSPYLCFIPIFKGFSMFWLV